MFISEEIIEDKRPFMAVFAPEHEFVLKYFDRCFDRRITSDARGDTAVVLKSDDAKEGEDERAFRLECGKRGIPVVTLRLPAVLGTGMGDPLMRLARGVARGTLMKIDANKAVWSVVHAVDVANVAKTVLQTNPATDREYVVSAPPVAVNDLIAAFGQRIKNKKVGTIKPKWAKLLYGRSYFSKLTADKTVDTSAFTSDFPEYEFQNPVTYLTTHDYNDESL